MQDVAVIIPARYQSTRFPGKPLALIKGVPMIYRVWKLCCEAVGRKQVYIATDSEKIYNSCKKYQIKNIIMTSEDCLTGTDRVAEAAQHIDADIIVNVQGDEPLINPQDILKVVNGYQESSKDIVAAMSKITCEHEFFSLSVPKVIFNYQKKLLYMSRAPIPANKENKFYQAWKQVCIYAFSKKALEVFKQQNKKSPFEAIEDIEILRFIELGYDIQMVELASNSVAVDHPEDIIKVEGILGHG